MAQNEKGWDKVVAWYARNSYAVNMVYSLGASVVIIGALFKILHWPGASYVLMAGMFTEAFLFFIGIFEKPHAVYNWENVFPQLIGHDSKPMGQINGSISGFGGAAAPGLDEKDAKALKESIENIANTANALTDLTKLAEGTNKLSEKLAAAAEAADKFAGAEEGLVAGATQAAQAAAQSTEVASQAAAAVANNLNALNAAYEAQAKLAQTGAKDAEAFAAAQQKLAQQVANLNLNAQIMAERLANALERGWYFRKAGSSVIRRVMDSGARGCEVIIAGKLTGARARVQKFVEGYIKHSGEPAESIVETGYATAVKKLGIIGVQVKIVLPGAVLPDHFGIRPDANPVPAQVAEADVFEEFDAKLAREPELGPELHEGA